MLVSEGLGAFIFTLIDAVIVLLFNLSIAFAVFLTALLLSFKDVIANAVFLTFFDLSCSLSICSAVFLTFSELSGISPISPFKVEIVDCRVEKASPSSDNAVVIPEVSIEKVSVVLVLAFKVNPFCSNLLAASTFPFTALNREPSLELKETSASTSTGTSSTFEARSVLFR